MILQQDSLVSTNKFFRLSGWLDQAIDFGDTEYEKTLALKNAKMQITIWGPDWNPKTDLRDYANKEWSGLLRTLYYPRWQMFVDSYNQFFQGKSLPVIDYFTFEKDWASSSELYPDLVLSSILTDRLINTILE